MATPTRKRQIHLAEGRALDTDPRTVLTAVRIGANRDVRSALATANRPRGLVNDHDLRFGDFDRFRQPTVLPPSKGEYFLQVMSEPTIEGFRHRMGHDSSVAARVLLKSNGFCTGCDARLPLNGDDARFQVHVRTVVNDWTTPRDDLRDWPAALCNACLAEMRRGGHTSFLDYRFIRNGACPACAAGTSYVKVGDMVDEFTYENLPPWQVVMGFGSLETHRFCSTCHHEW